MKQVEVIIERGNSKSFSAYTTESFGKFMLAGFGTTAEEAKEDFMKSYQEVKEEFQCEDMEFSFKYDTSSFLQLFNEMLSLTGLQKLTGINNKQLSHYLTGHRKPSALTSKKIAERVHQFGKELAEIEFVY